MLQSLQKDKRAMNTPTPTPDSGDATSGRIRRDLEAIAAAKPLQRCRIGRMDAPRSKSRAWAVWDGPTCIATGMTRHEAAAMYAGMCWAEEARMPAPVGPYRRAWTARGA